MFHFYEKPGWFFSWSDPNWRLEPGFEEGRYAIYTCKYLQQTQIFELHRHSTKYQEGWTPIDVTGFWLKKKESHNGAPIGAFLRELRSVSARALAETNIDKYLPHKTYDSLQNKYCGCRFYQPDLGCSVHVHSCKCDVNLLLAQGCKCGGA